MNEPQDIKDESLLEEVSFSESYIFTRQGETFAKTVTYFLALVKSATVVHQLEEIQTYTWANYETAINLISYAQSKQILQDVNQYLSCWNRI
ncbi:hypothetical protein [Floridanema evergladense]|uniref:Uncharacterized protein n=1 Tax=Floridaenema evergladense BLCC-F167 TaxID=3153639 RepID=A0ABV4WHD8_9CYAN